MSAKGNQTSTRRTDLAIGASQATAIIRGMRIGATYVRFTDDVQVHDAQLASFRKYYADLNALADRLLATSTRPQSQERIRQLKADGATYAAGAEEIADAAARNRRHSEKSASIALAPADATRARGIERRDQLWPPEAKAIPAASNATKIAGRAL